MVHIRYGIFSDAYDLLNIGYILTIITDSYKYAGITIPGFTEYLVGSNSAFWTGLLASISLRSAIIGQLFFGVLGDYWGRKKVYGVEATILGIGALLSALSPNLWAYNLQVHTGYRYWRRLPNFGYNNE
jgi:PHS family inorganic phosphate transporter-like MFS transporter